MTEDYEKAKHSLKALEDHFSGLQTELAAGHGLTSHQLAAGEEHVKALKSHLHKLKPEPAPPKPAPAVEKPPAATKRPVKSHVGEKK